MPEVTLILNAIEAGDAHATAKLLPLVYDELRRMARQHMAHERAQHTLQATELVHEAYLRMVGDTPVRFDGRGHFYAAASEAMRRILIDHARTKAALRHGGAQGRVAFENALPEIASPCKSPEELLDLSDALDRLATEDPARAQLVTLIFFGGLSLEEAGAVMGLSRAAAYRSLSFARAWLNESINGTRAGTPQ